MRKHLAAPFLCLTAVALPTASALPPLPPAHNPEIISPQPVIPADGSWVGLVLIVSAGLFVSAAIIGPILHREFPEEVPPAHAHEAPGSSHRHGPGGTFSPEPP